MPRLFNVDIAGIINKELGPLLLDLVLTKVTAGTRNPSNLAAGTNPTRVVHKGKGFSEGFELGKFDTSLVQADDKMITILGDSISVVPEVNDEITIESFKYNIVGPVKRDPAGATYLCHGRLI